MQQNRKAYIKRLYYITFSAIASVLCESLTLCTLARSLMTNMQLNLHVLHRFQKLQSKHSFILESSFCSIKLHLTAIL